MSRNGTLSFVRTSLLGQPEERYPLSTEANEVMDRDRKMRSLKDTG
jgi:hypothetical protein